jgi:tRNA U38,U39,U40 pseudouridine synthase TruA
MHRKRRGMNPSRCALLDQNRVGIITRLVAIHLFLGLVDSSFLGLSAVFTIPVSGFASVAVAWGSPGTTRHRQRQKEHHLPFLRFHSSCTRDTAKYSCSNYNNMKEATSANAFTVAASAASSKAEEEESSRPGAENTMRVSLTSITANVPTTPPGTATPVHSNTTIYCAYCSRPFVSRNKLFRHFQSEGCTPETPCAPLNADPGTNTAMVKQSIAILFGYVHNTTATTDVETIADDSSMMGTTSNSGDKPPFVPRAMNEWAGQLVFQAVKSCLEEYTQQQQCDNNTATRPAYFQLQSSRTQSSMARHRSRILQQEPDCLAAGDVLVVTVSCLESSREQIELALSTLPMRVLLDLDQDTRKETEKSGASSLHKTNTTAIRIWSYKLLSPNVTLHAERGCTQMVYHYLVPSHWLPHGDLLKQHWRGWDQPPPVDSLTKFRVALQTMISDTVSQAQPPKKKKGSGTNQNNRDESVSKSSPLLKKLALGRFGRLSMKERRAWHNFANPLLRGEVSPNQGNVWRCVDSCQIAGVLGFAASTNDENDPVIVVEVRGDAFLPQQVRRIIGTALAMTHGWIPSSPAAGSQTLWSPECVMETPLAPPGRLYLAKCRFHYEEGRNSGQSIFVTDSGGKAIDVTQSSSPEDEAPLAWTQRLIQQSRSDPTVQHLEQQWLTELQEQIAPRMTQSLASFSDTIPSSLNVDDSFHGISVPTTSNVIVTSDNKTIPQQPAPLEFIAVLEKLRTIVRDGRWPDTSVARSNVIRGLPTTTRRQDDSNEAHTNTGGSFTVINSRILLEDNTTTTPTTNVPLGNELFPDLVQAVFELEEAIANQAKIVEVSTSNGQIVMLPSRHELSSSPLSSWSSSATNGQGPEQQEFQQPRHFASSTHCAINCNAQFKPHVDSGRGAGQSRSIIVGLGDYTRGGELIVEGNYFDIRYQPLEFDGWTLRHWTNQFQGERFSLVWFTPSPNE